MKISRRSMKYLKSASSHFHPKVETGYFKAQMMIVYQLLYSFFMFLSFDYKVCMLIVYENAVCRVADVPGNTVMPCVGHLMDLVLWHVKCHHTRGYCLYRHVFKPTDSLLSTLSLSFLLYM